MKILEMYPYMMGKKYTTDEKKEPVRCTKEMITNFQKALLTSLTAEENLKNIEDYKAFYKCEPIVASMIPAEEREEVFYAAKLEYFSPIIPSRYLFLLSKIKEEVGSFNLIPVVLSQYDVKRLFAKGTIADGYCLRDVICSLFQKEYKPVSDAVRGVKIDDYWEVCLEKENRIIMIPDKLRQQLSDDDLEKIHIVKKNVMLGDIQLRFISNDFLGVYNKIYDMRGLM